MPIDAAEATVDTLLAGRVRIVQPNDGYRVAIDSVLLAAAVPAAPGQSILDVGAGTGAASFCLLARRPGLRVTAVEPDPDHAALLWQGIQLNSFGDRIEIVGCTIENPSPALKQRQFDHVMTNPPYHVKGANRRPAQMSRDAAGHESLPLADWLAACARRVRSGGRLTLVHRADRLDRILAELAGEFGEVTILPLWPRADTGSASRVIVVARKSSRTLARLCRGLVLHEDDGRFTSALQRILRDAAPLCGAADQRE